jgi:hypothetical protein
MVVGVTTDLAVLVVAVECVRLGVVLVVVLDAFGDGGDLVGGKAVVGVVILSMALGLASAGGC